MRRVIVVLSVLLIVLPCVVTADETPAPAGAPAPPPSPPPNTTTDKTPAQKLTDANKDFLGVNFSFGFGAVFFGGRVDEAQVIGQGDNARVIVTKDASKKPALVLEAHRLLDLKSRNRCFTTKQGNQCQGKGAQPKEAGAQDTERVAFGLGPFMALQTSQDDKVIDTIGFGLMGGFHIGEGKAFNLGIGAMLDPAAKFLPPGYKDGEAPPKGYVAGDQVAGGGTLVPLVSKSKLGLMILASFTF